MKRREFITLVGGAAAWPVAARAQRAMPVIGFLNLGSPTLYTHLTAAFHRGLGEAGFIEGQNVLVEYRWANTQAKLLPDLAADLVRRQVAVIVANPNDAALAAKAATDTIPIVFGVGSDPVKTGLVASFSKPGGNATGVNYFTSELGAKRLGLLRELVPSATRIAVLANPTAPHAESVIGDVSRAAHVIGLQVAFYYASSNAEIDAAFTALAQQRSDAIFVVANPLFTTQRDQLTTLALRHAMPSMFVSREFAEVGGLLTYGTSLADMYRQVGIYTGKVLNGVRPADLPVVQPTKFELVINLKTAKTLGLTIPPTLLARADEVIE